MAEKKGGERVEGGVKERRPDFKDRQRIEDGTTRHERRSAKTKGEQGHLSTCAVGGG